MQSKMIRETHKSRALYYIRTYGSITSLEAIRDLGNTRLSDTIFRLRNEGYGISTEDHQVATRWVDAKGDRKYSTVAKYVFKTNKP